MARISGLFREAGRSIRSRMITGLVVIAPILITLWVVRFVFNLLDGWLRPIVHHVMHRRVPGVGLLATLLLVYLVGLIASNLVGRTLVAWTERFILRLPLIGDVYGSSKQIMEAVSHPDSFGFKRVVTFEFPRSGVRAIGFVTREMLSPEGVRQVAVFMPHTPNPTTGYLLVLPATDVETAGLTVDEAVKMIVSGGVVWPGSFRPHSGRPAPARTPDPERIAETPPKLG